MTYEEFLKIPIDVLKDLETIFFLKSKYNMDITSEEREIYEHMEKDYDERVKNLELCPQKRKLEELFKKMTNFLKPILEGFASIGEGFYTIANSFNSRSSIKSYDDVRKKYDEVRKKYNKIRSKDTF